MKANIWTDKEEQLVFGPLKGNHEADVVVIGAGITGLTAAHQLTEAGKKVIVVEAETIAHGTSANSSAHLTTSIDFSYAGLAEKHGKDTAKSVADSRLTAIAFIAQMAEHFPCDFKYVPGFLYSETEEKIIDNEFRHASEAGLKVAFADKLLLPFKVKKGIEFKDQAIFQPYKYLKEISIFLKASKNCEIYDNSRVISRNNNEISTSEGSVKAKDLIFATHYPLFIDMHQTMAYPYRSYMLAAKTEEDTGDGVYWDTAEPYRYTRTFRNDGQRYLLVGGADHKTGHTNEESYIQLENYLRERYNVQSIDYKWSSQYYEPADGLPYMGKSYNGKEYMGTGYSGDGLVYGTIAGLLISNEIQGMKNNMWNGVYNSQRVNPMKSAGKFGSENIAVASHLVKDRLKSENRKDPTDLKNGEGIIIKKDGKNLAVSRDENGQLKEVSAVCPHLKCFVQWNTLEKSWDCPCHGSRFTPSGDVLTGPAVQGL